MAKGPGPTHIQPGPHPKKHAAGTALRNTQLYQLTPAAVGNGGYRPGRCRRRHRLHLHATPGKSSPLTIAHPIHLPARVPIAGVAARIMPATTHVIYLPSGVAITRVALGLRWRRDAKYGRRRYASTYAKCGKHRASTDPPLREDTSISERERFVDVAGGKFVCHVGTSNVAPILLTASVRMQVTGLQS
jgi:hypothetical protein